MGDEGGRKKSCRRRSSNTRNYGRSFRLLYIPEAVVLHPATSCPPSPIPTVICSTLDYHLCNLSPGRSHLVCGTSEYRQWRAQFPATAESGRWLQSGEWTGFLESGRGLRGGPRPRMVGRRIILKLEGSECDCGRIVEGVQ